MTENNASPDKSKAKPKKEKEIEEQTKVKGWLGSLFVESIIWDFKPMFLCYDKTSKRITLKDSVEYGRVIYVPLDLENIGYDPYFFRSAELDELQTSNLTKEDLLSEIADLVNTYLDAIDEIKTLVIGDLFLSYCQEWIRTIHFIFAVGETESGKSTLVYLFKLLAYRCLYGTNIPAADVYNFLGTSEEGTGTIAEDEAQDISFRPGGPESSCDGHGDGERHGEPCGCHIRKHGSGSREECQHIRLDSRSRRARPSSTIGADLRRWSCADERCTGQIRAGDFRRSRRSASRGDRSQLVRRAHSTGRRSDPLASRVADEKLTRNFVVGSRADDSHQMNGRRPSGVSWVETCRNSAAWHCQH